MIVEFLPLQIEIRLLFKKKYAKKTRNRQRGNSRTEMSTKRRVKPEPARINNSKGSTRRRWARQYPNVELTPIRYEQRTAHGTWSYKHSLDMAWTGSSHQSMHWVWINSVAHTASRLPSQLLSWIPLPLILHFHIAPCVLGRRLWQCRQSSAKFIDAFFAGFCISSITDSYHPHECNLGENRMKKGCSSPTALLYLPITMCDCELKQTYDH